MAFEEFQATLRPTACVAVEDRTALPLSMASIAAEESAAWPAEPQLEHNELSSAEEFLSSAFSFDTAGFNASSAAIFLRNVQSVCESDIAEQVCEPEDGAFDDQASNVSWNSCG